VITPRSRAPVPWITLVLGGTRSGKSAIGEQLAARLAPPVTYVATALRPTDDPDHAVRIAAHRARRDPSWATLEVGAALAGTLRTVPGSLLVDSLGTWVGAHEGADVAIDPLVDALRSRIGDTVLVSEEVGLGVHPSSEVGRHFRDVLGEVNAAVAEVADDVLFVIAGRVLPLGRLQEPT
jgi:adenosylcobinamide kinase / adenosylcobinamide-phosphate guanylyltransferase